MNTRAVTLAWKLARDRAYYEDQEVPEINESAFVNPPPEQPSEEPGPRRYALWVRYAGCDKPVSRIYEVSYDDVDKEIHNKLIDEGIFEFVGKHVTHFARAAEIAEIEIGDEMLG